MPATTNRTIPSGTLTAKPPQRTNRWRKPKTIATDATISLVSTRLPAQSVDVSIRGDDETRYDLHLTPENARRLAEKLLTAADRAEEPPLTCSIPSA